MFRRDVVTPAFVWFVQSYGLAGEPGYACKPGGRNIMDNKPMVNIRQFGARMSLANPTVADATLAAVELLTPMPYIPLKTAPWTLGAPAVRMPNMPALNNTPKSICNWPGSFLLIIPDKWQGRSHE